jgi:FtsP/CotA-like multicopper oxidase with cupredoxin domain
MMVLMVLRNAPFLRETPRPTPSWPNNTALPGRVYFILSNIQVLTYFLRYHSHFSTQYANGVVGSIVINGPASLPYDIDLGAFPISDWYLGAAEQIEERVGNPNDPFFPGAVGAPPPSDNILFNGSNINPNGPGGWYYNVTLTPGKRHLLRIINPSVENQFTVSLVGHDLKVIETDFVPVDAFTTSSLYLGIGQRYTVTIDASQAVGNYWFNVSFSGTGGCGTSVNKFPAAIFSYVGAPNALPNNTGIVPADSLCADNLNFSPIVSRTAPLTNFSPTLNNLSVNFVVDSAISKVAWQVNGSAIDVQWDKPTLQYVLNGETDFPGSENIIQVPETNEVSTDAMQTLKHAALLTNFLSGLSG